MILMGSSSSSYTKQLQILDFKSSCVIKDSCHLQYFRPFDRVSYINPLTVLNGFLKEMNSVCQTQRITYIAHCCGRTTTFSGVNIPATGRGIGVRVHEAYELVRPGGRLFITKVAFRAVVFQEGAFQ